MPGLESQQSNNIIVREIRDKLGFDMWSPDSPEFNRRELPVDVPKALLEQTRPNNTHLSFGKPSQTPDSTATSSKKSTIPTDSPSSMSQSVLVNNTSFSQSYHHTIVSITNTETKSVATKDSFEEDFLEEDLGGQKETSVDVDEDYPFAKEDYPTILKSCSDDSGASLRSSSGRSDSTVPVDSSLVTNKSITSRMDGIKVLMRSEQVSDLTQLITSQEQLDKIGVTASSKKSKAPKKSTKPQAEAEELLLRKSDSTDELNDLGQVSMSSVKTQKRQQSSSGYSTLQSNISDHGDSARPFFTINNSKRYREVAVDCPEDFIPVTKCHPVYPPPNKTPQGTLESKRRDTSKRKSKDYSNFKNNFTNNNESNSRSGTLKSLPPAPVIPPVPIAERKVEKKVAFITQFCNIHTVK